MLHYIIILLISVITPLQACRNTISNNTATTFKLVEIKQENADIKQQVILPEAYITNEDLARTLKPGEETDFGGHYLPKYIIYKEFTDKKWHPLIYVKQVRCAPDGADPSRFPENKYLLITDLLQQKLPNDYQQVYEFTVKCEPSQLNIESSNKALLAQIDNPYQELVRLVDDFTQKIQELLSRVLQQQDKTKSGQAKEPVQAKEPIAETAITCVGCAS